MTDFFDENSDTVLFNVSLAILFFTVMTDTYQKYAVILKALQYVFSVFGLFLTYRRYKTRKPFYKNITPQDYTQVGSDCIVKILKSEHDRGKNPVVKCLVPGEHGGYTECLTDAAIDDDGTVIVVAAAAFPIRVEIRK